MRHQPIIGILGNVRRDPDPDFVSVAKGEDRLFRKVVKGMLPKNRLGDKLLNNLYVYAGSEHKHEAQQPKSIDINSLN